MARILESLKNLFRRPETVLSDEEVELLRVDFKARYHQFQLLLRANSNSLELMADIEQALMEKKPYGMNFVRSRCTKACIEVLRMVKSLNRLSTDRYKEL